MHTLLIAEDHYESEECPQSQPQAREPNDEAMDPDLATHSVKPPLYLTSTFSFSSAEHGKAYAEVINGLRKQRLDEGFSNTHIYSRDTNSNFEIFE